MIKPPCSADFNISGSKKPVKLGLALQGGGSYGAFTAGVVKALMKNPAFRNGDIQIIGISGASSGANNAAVVTDGLKNGGPDQVIKNLDKFWASIASHGQALELMPHLAFWARYPNLPKMLVDYSKLFASLTSAGPQSYLLDLIGKSVNWENLNKGKPKLFTNAIEVNPQTGQESHVIFEEHCPETIVASANLPEFGPLKFRGQYYYDGALGHNPSICPLEELHGLTDIMVIHLNKTGLYYEATHQDNMCDVYKKDSEGFVTHHLTAHLNHILEDRQKEYHLHEIALKPDTWWNETSRMNPMPRWLDELMEMGEKAGEEWLRTHLNDLGEQSSYTANLPPKDFANERFQQAAVA